MSAYPRWSARPARFISTPFKLKSPLSVWRQPQVMPGT
jgi:hypothetical protein